MASSQTVRAIGRRQPRRAGANGHRHLPGHHQAPARALRDADDGAFKRAPTTTQPPAHC